jgi:hypothetical protein
VKGDAVIPPAVLEQGEQAFVRVLRRRHPGAAFVLGDCPVRPEDANVPGQILGGATGDLDPIEEAGENLAAFEGVETAPQGAERPAVGQPGEAG